MPVSKISVPGNALLIKQINTRLVRTSLKTVKKATKLQLAALTGLTNVTVGTILHELLQSGEISEGDLIPSMGGRPSREYLYNPDFCHVAYVYGFEKKGKDTFYIRIANLFGEPIYEEEQQLDQIMIFDFYLMLDKAFSAYQRIGSIGLSLPGVVSDGKLISDYIHLNGDGFLETFRQKYGVPVIFENDVNAACLGYCQKQQISADVPLLYGYFPQKSLPGLALFLNGQLFRGYRNFAGEIRSEYFDLQWTDPAFYEASDAFAPHFSRFLAQISCVISPAKIVLAGEQFTETVMRELTKELIQIYDSNARPSLTVTSSFQQDLDNGICTAALNALETRDGHVQPD